MRAFHKQQGVVAGKKKGNSKVADLILAKEPSIEVSFKVPKSLWADGKKKIARFPPNPGTLFLVCRFS